MSELRHHCLVSSFVPLPSVPRSLPTADQATGDSFLEPEALPFLEFLINGIRQDVVFSLWILFLSKIQSSLLLPLGRSFLVLSRSPLYGQLVTCVYIPLPRNFEIFLFCGSCESRQYEHLYKSVCEMKTSVFVSSG